MLAKTLKRTQPGLIRSQRRRAAEHVVQRTQLHVNDEARAELSRFMQQGADELGIFCLCEAPDDILMWSHYGDSHRGLCLGFRSTTELGIPLDVEYQREFPITDPLKHSFEEQVQLCLLTKAERWAYEREWRIIDLERPPGVRTFPPEMLTSVTFGCQISAADRKDVEAWIRSGPCRPELREAKIRHRTYEVEIHPC